MEHALIGRTRMPRRKWRECLHGLTLQRGSVKSGGFAYRADVAELADALASGASGGNPVEVRILSSANTTREYSQGQICLPLDVPNWHRHTSA
jgi:hypothetical protein